MLVSAHLCINCRRGSAFFRTTFLVLKLDCVDATLEISSIPALAMHEGNAMRGGSTSYVRIRYLHISAMVENRDLLFAKPELK